MASLYETIRSLCVSRGITPGKLCSELEIPRSMLSDLKMGRKKSLSASNISKIARYFDVSADVLLGGEPAGTAPPSGAERAALSDEGVHIGTLFDRADEKDRLLTHSVLDKYAEAGTITAIRAKSRNAGGFVEFDVYDEPAAAGLGNYLDAPKAQREQFPSVIVPRGADFGIRVSGRSMEPAVADGSTVFVRQTVSVEPGRIGIFVLNGAAYCKQLIVDRARMEVRLHSLNPEYADIVVQPSDTLVTIGQVL